MRIGILQCGQSPEQLKGRLGDYPDMFMRLLCGQGFEFRVWLVEEQQFPGDIHDADGWLLTGSRHGVYEDHAFIPPLEDFIRRAYAAEVPLVGICFGHQIIAQALGGKVVKHPKGWVVGAQDYDLNGKPVTLNAWHQDQVVTLPDGARIVGRSESCDYAALIYGDRAWTVQPHPEFQDEFVQGLMDTRAKGVVPQKLLDRAASRMGDAKSSDAIAEQIAAFFKRARNTAKGAA